MSALNESRAEWPGYFFNQKNLTMKFQSATKKTSSLYKPIALGMIIALNIFFVSCHDAAKTDTGQHSPAMEKKDSSLAKYALKDVANRKDPVCGMPLTAGIGDTLHFHDKALGFCSEECKKDFMKDPEKYIAAADLKTETGK